METIDLDLLFEIYCIYPNKAANLEAYLCKGFHLINSYHSFLLSNQGSSHLRVASVLINKV